MMSDIIYRYKDNVYLNITNKCPCRCTFCIRNTEDAIGDAENLWLSKEPSLEEIYQAIDAYDFTGCTGVVFCGYGEPVMALDNLIAVSHYIKEKYGFHVRVNTNGLGDLIHKRSIAKELCEAVDSISISMNTPDAKSYNEVVRPAYGEKSFDAMLKFAQDCRKYLDDVRFTVVSVIGEEAIEKCRKLADSLGVPFRVRQYSE
ncbi:radical SAM protein [Blautia sp. An249]|uniref:TIGR04100 family radical SAM protein n=1 Tax=Blautia sp. An249 TaxID=1965603 RepID=UPI000B3A16E5|nr:radical SAM protein [Blautia sp. An249]